mgnify:FL=1
MSKNVQFFSFSSPIICNKLEACYLNKDDGLIFHKEELAFDVLNAINESREEKLEPTFLSDKVIVFKQINFDDNLITISIEEK